MSDEARRLAVCFVPRNWAYGTTASPDAWRFAGLTDIGELSKF